jgi:hypothetical protein
MRMKLNTDNGRIKKVCKDGVKGNICENTETEALCPKTQLNK